MSAPNNDYNIAIDIAPAEPPMAPDIVIVQAPPVDAPLAIAIGEAIAVLPAEPVFPDEEDIPVDDATVEDTYYSEDYGYDDYYDDDDGGDWYWNDGGGYADY